MKRACILLTLAMLACGGQHDAKPSTVDANKKSNIKEKSENSAALSPKTNLLLGVTDRSSEFLRQEDHCGAPSGCLFARIVDANSDDQTVTVQYGYAVKTITHGPIFPDVIQLVLNAKDGNTSNMSGFRGENDSFRFSLTVEGDYCWMMLSDDKTGKSTVIRDYSCNLVVKKS